MYKLLVTKSSAKELEKLPKTISTRMVVALDELAIRGVTSSNVKKLQTPFPGYRKRIGDYRILFEINNELIVVYKISKRADVYR